MYSVEFMVFLALFWIYWGGAIGYYSERKWKPEDTVLTRFFSSAAWVVMAGRKLGELTAR
jgi:hypothetical protein